jgi:hypothetical protein
MFGVSLCYYVRIDRHDLAAFRQLPDNLKERTGELE